MSETSWLLKDLIRRWGDVARQHDPDGYPAALEESFRDRRGRQVELRPVRPDDVPLFRAGFAALSPETVYHRFHSHLDHLSDDALRYLTHVDYQHHLALVALHAGALIGVARYYLPEGEALAEAAVVVVDAFQRSGVGAHLMRRLIEAAEQRGVPGFQAFVQRENLAIRGMVERSGLRFHTEELDPETLRVWFRFDDYL